MVRFEWPVHCKWSGDSGSILITWLMFTPRTVLLVSENFVLSLGLKLVSQPIYF
jgi:hypothetical protein